MAMYLVTGGSGHLGANLVRGLLDQGASVRVVARGGSGNQALDGLDVERVEGDVRDYQSMLAAVRGCARVFHAAALISIAPSTPQRDRELFETNVVGTRNVLRAAREAGAKRVVVTGSVTAVGPCLDDPSRRSDEDVPFYPFDQVPSYAHTKAWAEHECLKAAALGQDVVIATSCAIIGPHDFKPSDAGRLLLDFASGNLRAYVPGGVEYVAARDVVQGHLLAMERGRTGHRYILSTEFRSIDSLLEHYEKVTGRPRPRVRIPAPLATVMARVSSLTLARMAPSVPQRLTPAAVHFLRSQRQVDNTKARTELGYRPTSLDQAVQEAYDDFVCRGLITPARSAP